MCSFLYIVSPLHSLALHFLLSSHFFPYPFLPTLLFCCLFFPLFPSCQYFIPCLFLPPFYLFPFYSSVIFPCPFFIFLSRSFIRLFHFSSLLCSSPLFPTLYIFLLDWGGVGKSNKHAAGFSEIWQCLDVLVKTL